MGCLATLLRQATGLRRLFVCCVLGATFLMLLLVLFSDWIAIRQRANIIVMKPSALEGTPSRNHTLQNHQLQPVGQGQMKNSLAINETPKLKFQQRIPEAAVQVAGGENNNEASLRSSIRHLAYQRASLANTSNVRDHQAVAMAKARNLNASQDQHQDQGRESQGQGQDQGQGRRLSDLAMPGRSASVEQNPTTRSETGHLGPIRMVSSEKRQRTIITEIRLSVRTSLEERERAYYRRRATKVSPFVHKMTVRPRESCAADTRMIVLVHSLHTYADRRAAIRDTWGKVGREGRWANGKPIAVRVRLVFLLGQPSDPSVNFTTIYEEARRFDDIAVGDFVDTYRNLTIKSLFGLKLAAELCPEVKYVLKADDDVFINFPHLLEILLMRSSFERTILGRLYVKAQLMDSGKWKLTKEEFPFGYFPPYEIGPAYVISGDLVKDMFETAEYLPQIFLEDVFVTGILGRVLNVTHALQPDFVLGANRVMALCEVVEQRIVAAVNINPSLLLKAWEELSGSTTRCHTISSRRGS